jgi:plastocyanin
MSRKISPRFTEKKSPPSAHQLEFLKFFGNKPVPRSLLNLVKAQFKTTFAILASALFSVALVQNSPAATTTVQVGSGFSDTFDPPTVSISVNDSVIWDWQGTFHSSTSGSPPGSPDGLWESGLITSTPHFFTNTFTTAGTFPYFCEYHYFYGMTGEVDVAGSVAAVPPTLAVTAPKDGAVLAAPANVSLQAGVTNGSGTVTNVQFLVNNNLLASENSGPFSATTNNLTAGAYTLTAIALDDGGLAATNSVAINVVTPVSVSMTNLARPSGTHFQFAYSADIGLNYVVQRSADMMNWISLATNQAANNPVIFDDPNATNGLDYYRVGRMPNP